MEEAPVADIGEETASASCEHFGLTNDTSTALLFDHLLTGILVAQHGAAKVDGDLAVPGIGVSFQEGSTAGDTSIGDHLVTHACQHEHGR